MSILTTHPGAPFWSAFTAFCSNEVALFALDKVQVITIDRFWAVSLGSTFVAGAVYGREKLAEVRKARNGGDGDAGFLSAT